MNELTTIANSAEEGRFFTVIKMENLLDDGPVCKICFGDMIEEFKPCNCTDSIGNVHKE